jgi:hypothetical protein
MSLEGRNNPELWELAKKEAINRMGGLHSARAMQLAGKIYRDNGGTYTKEKTKAQKDLTKWTKEEWTTKSGLKSSLTGERYLPKKIIEGLTDKQYEKTSKAKLEGMRQGIQFVKQPMQIINAIHKLKKYK